MLIGKQERKDAREKRLLAFFPALGERSLLMSPWSETTFLHRARSSALLPHFSWVVSESAVILLIPAFLSQTMNQLPAAEFLSCLFFMHVFAVVLSQRLRYLTVFLLHCSVNV